MLRRASVLPTHHLSVGQFAIKHVGDDGSEHEFIVEDVEPLDFVTLRDCLREGRRSHPTVMRGRPRGDDGTPDGDRIKLTFPIEFRERIPFYGLVRGGVLPAPYLNHTTFVLDKNIVRALQRREDSVLEQAAGEQWCFEFLDSSGNTVNPMMSAFEGSQRRTPTLEEFQDDVQEAVECTSVRLPAVSITRFDTETIRRLYEWRRSFDDRAASEARFLRSVAPFLADPVAVSRLEAVERQVLQEARACGLRTSLVVVTALARLYESPDEIGGNAAVRVLKLHDCLKEDSDEAAYNAIADLRQIELFACTLAFPGRFALLTGDQHLAMLWCGLGVQEVQVGRKAHFTLSPARELFPRLGAQRHRELLAALSPHLGQSGEVLP